MTDILNGRLAAFRDALEEALRMQRLTPAELSRLLKLPQSTISGWRQGTSEPRPSNVFALEEALKLPPGHLSRHLGYYPPESILEAGAAGLDSLLLADESLTENWRRSVLAIYREARAASAIEREFRIGGEA